MILLCYDGSDDARAAVKHAGHLPARHSAYSLAVIVVPSPQVASARVHRGGASHKA